MTISAKTKGRFLCFAAVATLAVFVNNASAADSQSDGAERVINSYIDRSFAKDLNGTLNLFEVSLDTYYHVNGIFYFTVDKNQAVFQVASARNYGDGWLAVRQGFADYFTTLVEALSVKTVVRTEGQGMNAPLDGGDKIQGETSYAILAKFIVDAQGHTGYAIVHGLDQFRIKHNKINNVNNLEKTVFLTQQESDYLDSLTSRAAKINWGRQRTCELKNSVFATIDIEKRYDLALPCR